MRRICWSVLGLMLFSVLTAGTACSSGDDGDAKICVDFEADAAAAASTATSTEGSGSGCGTVVVELSLTDVSDVYTVSFDANFNTNLVRYEGYSIGGSHLSSDGAQLQVIENVSAGQVSLGITRLNPATTGVNFTGTQRVVRLTFKRASGVDDGDSGSFSFSNPKVLDSGSPQPQEIPGVSWFGGTFRAS